MYDCIVNPAPYGDYYIAIQAEDEWTCPHCGTHWENWGAHAEDANRPWEDGEITSAEPDHGWCCPACAVNNAGFSTMRRFVEDYKLQDEIINATLTEDGEGAIEHPFREELWTLYAMGFSADFNALMKEYIQSNFGWEFRQWLEGE